MNLFKNHKPHIYSDPLTYQKNTHAPQFIQAIRPPNIQHRKDLWPEINRLLQKPVLTPSPFKISGINIQSQYTPTQITKDRISLPSQRKVTHPQIIDKNVEGTKSIGRPRQISHYIDGHRNINHHKGPHYVHNQGLNRTHYRHAQVINPPNLQNLSVISPKINNLTNLHPTNKLQVSGHPPSRSRIEHVPYKRKYYQMQAREVVNVVYVPVQKLKTQYYAIEHITQYQQVPYEQTVIEYVPQQKIKMKVEYQLVQKKIVHYPKDKDIDVIGVKKDVQTANLNLIKVQQLPAHYQTNYVTSQVPSYKMSLEDEIKFLREKKAIFEESMQLKQQ